LKVEFVTSAVDRDGFPRDPLPELAMAGRSNVGKSSLINALVRQKVARTSAAPGKTRLANFYRVSREGAPAFYLVDLPGYGYARGSRQVRGDSAQAARDAARREFDAIARDYFDPRRGRERGRTGGVAGVLLLVDSRHPTLEADRRTWEWLRDIGVDPVVVATKLDKLTRQERVEHLGTLAAWHQGPVQGVSAQTGEGLKDLWKTIDRLLRQPPLTRELQPQ
jgi:GTP-binding protein